MIASLDFVVEAAVFIMEERKRGGSREGIVARRSALFADSDAGKDMSGDRLSNHYLCLPQPMLVEYSPLLSFFILLAQLTTHDLHQQIPHILSTYKM
jgi:hypothetical protein